MSGTVRRRVKRVLDGDTFETYRSVNGSRFIRVANLWAPEKRQYGYGSAKQKLDMLIGGKIVKIKPVGRSYGRTVAHVSRYGNVARKMRR